MFKTLNLLQFNNINIFFASPTLSFKNNFFKDNANLDNNISAHDCVDNKHFAQLS